jgi:hypothetical protein
LEVAPLNAGFALALTFGAGAGRRGLVFMLAGFLALGLAVFEEVFLAAAFLLLAGSGLPRFDEDRAAEREMALRFSGELVLEREAEAAVFAAFRARLESDSLILGLSSKKLFSRRRCCRAVKWFLSLYSFLRRFDFYPATRGWNSAKSKSQRAAMPDPGGTEATCYVLTNHSQGWDCIRIWLIL